LLPGLEEAGMLRHYASYCEAQNTLAKKLTAAETVDFVADTVNFIAGFGNKSATT